MQPTAGRTDGKKVVIIGGGPAGLTAAYQLSKLDAQSVVLEKDQVIGGISKTVSYKNFLFDIGGHRFFTKIKPVEDIWKEILDKDLLHRKRLSRIYYNKKFFFYPLRPFNALSGLGVWKSIIIILSYLYIRLFPFKHEETFEHWVSNRFGKQLYKTFFKPYTEKVWGLPCTEIRAEWAAQRISGLSLVKAVRNAFAKQNRNNGGKAAVRTLIDSFDYPRYGPGMMWQAMSRIIQDNGSRVYLGSEVEAVLWDKKIGKINSLEVKVNGKNKFFKGTNFISSMPVKELIQKFKPAVPEEVLQAANNLNYRDFLTVALIVSKPELFPDNWIYIHDPDVRLGRVQNFKNWSPYMVPDVNRTCLGLEYFCFEDDEIWNMPDGELIEFGIREMEKLGLIKSSDVEDGSVVRMPKAYPIHDLKYHKIIGIIRGFLSGIDNLQLVGRNGMHRYNNQDHSMLTAMLAVENIYGSNHDLWNVNVD